MSLPGRALAASLMSLLVAACAAPEPSPSAAPIRRAASPDPSSPPTASPPPASETPRPTPDPTPVPIADDPPPLALEVVAGGLAAPIGIATGPPGWLLVQEHRGRLVALDVASGATSVALDISDRLLGGGERGLLGLALHPDFPDDPRAFVHYTDRGGDTVLAAFEVTGVEGPIAIDSTTERVLLRVVQPFSNHNGGQLAFGPDGYLWFGLGDFGIRSDVPQPGPGETAPGPARLLLETGANISSFGEDADGELHIADHASGTIYRIVGAP